MSIARYRCTEGYGDSGCGLEGDGDGDCVMYDDHLDAIATLTAERDAARAERDHERIDRLCAESEIGRVHQMAEGESRSIAHPVGAVVARLDAAEKERDALRRAGYALLREYTDDSTGRIGTNQSPWAIAHSRWVELARLVSHDDEQRAALADAGAK
jgi:hypothetical protein